MSDKLLGRYILWDGKPAEVISDTSGERFVGIRKLQADECPHCHKLLEPRVFDVVYDSPYWRTMVRPMPTIAARTNDNLMKGEGE